jgi:hypothetical protein
MNNKRKRKKKDYIGCCPSDVNWGPQDLRWSWLLGQWNNQCPVEFINELKKSKYAGNTEVSQTSQAH